MKERREKRNLRIKREMTSLLRSGYLLYEAATVVAEKYFLSERQCYRIYYETRIEQG
ncbi:MAG TPA: hypothetical protein PL124_09075 [Candidatus Cloacimonadota bacterium]|nr:hypothetical protein [Candidatus Cloacimonadota bacterium]HPS39549.1 hypothetical protein [Candidatus Cloacimonadota bacterium]